MSTYELRPASSPPQVEGAADLVWPTHRGAEGALRSELSPCLDALGTVPTAAIDLVRIATAAYLADQRQARPTTFSRSIELHVHVHDVSIWTSSVLDDLADLLTSLSGDYWRLNVLADTTTDPCPAGAEVDSVARVALLSGGLDSFAGAVLSAMGEERVLYFGHWDNPAVKKAQNAVKGLVRAKRLPY